MVTACCAYSCYTERRGDVELHTKSKGEPGLARTDKYQIQPSNQGSGNHPAYGQLSKSASSARRLHHSGALVILVASSTCVRLKQDTLGFRRCEEEGFWLFMDEVYCLSTTRQEHFPVVGTKRSTIRLAASMLDCWTMNVSRPWDRRRLVICPWSSLIMVEARQRVTGYLLLSWKRNSEAAALNLEPRMSACFLF